MLNWKNVINYTKHYHGSILDIAETTYDLGYKYFVFNNSVYFVDDEGGYHDTEYTISDIK